MRYSLKEVLVVLLNHGYAIDWEIPYEITIIPEDLSRLNEVDSIVVKYWIKGFGQKSLKLTQVSNGLISQMYLCRTILPSVRMKLEEFESAKVIEETVNPQKTTH